MEEHIYIEKLSYGNCGIGHTQEGKTIFVPATAPGDKVEVSIDEDKPRFSVGHAVDFIERSPLRVEPPCAFYDFCGGCPWQHLSYPSQLEAKYNSVVEALVHTARISQDEALRLVAPCKGSKREFGYRNKLELSTNYTDKGAFSLGFKKEHSHSLTPPPECLVAHKALAQTPKALQGALSYLQGQRNLGIFRVGVRHSLRTHDFEVALWTTPGPFPRKMVAQTLMQSLKATSVVRLIAQPGKERSLKQVEALGGKGYWEENLESFTFKTSAPSFFQVNTAQAETMIKEVRLGLPSSQHAVLADLYAGGGTFSIPLAKEFETVFAVESASSSVKDLRRNARANHVSIEVVGGDSSRELPSLGALDALVVDPPRNGLSAEAIAHMAQAHPKHIAYVSCNPLTWARDVARLKEKGYTLTHVQPIDLFPQTYHIELVSFFER